MTKASGSHVTWQEKYLGIVDTLGLVMYMLDFMKADSQDDFEKQVPLLHWLFVFALLILPNTVLTYCII